MHLCNVCLNTQICHKVCKPSVHQYLTGNFCWACSYIKLIELHSLTMGLLCLIFELIECCVIACEESNRSSYFLKHYECQLCRAKMELDEWDANHRNRCMLQNPVKYMSMPILEYSSCQNCHSPLRKWEIQHIKVTNNLIFLCVLSKPEPMF